MATTKFKGTPVHTVGNLPGTGEDASDFVLTTGQLQDASLDDYAGKKKVLNIVPSLDTGVCAESARRFNKEIKAIGGTVVLTVSRDLPFAQNRFCEANSIDEVVTLSELRNRENHQQTDKYVFRVHSSILGRSKANRKANAIRLPILSDRPALCVQPFQGHLGLR